MTMPWGSTEEPDVVEVGQQSIPVHVVSSAARPGKSIGTEFGRWRTFLVANVVGPTSITPGAQRLANRSLRRHRMHIIVNGTVVGQPSTDGVIIGNRDEINGGQPAIPGQLAGYLQIGDNVRWEVQQELWVCYPATNTDPVFVTICDEVYASDPDEWQSDEENKG
jgi:hypothetical protein